MPVVDSDTHVDETEDTWDYLRPDEIDAGLKPAYYVSENFDPAKGPGHYWVFDGGVRQRRRVRSDEVTRTTRATRELLDVEARLRHMDQLGVDIHVIYPTLFATEFTERPELERAVKRGYNRWLGDRTGLTPESRERLRWVVVPPTLDLDYAIEEMRWGKEHGACGVLKKGDLEAGFWPAEDYFLPFYAEAERLDLTVCFHLGGGVPDTTSAARFSHVIHMRTHAPVMNGFDAIIRYEIPKQFPTLRFAFVELGASWIPSSVYALRRQAAHQVIAAGGVTGDSRLGGPRVNVGENLLLDNNIYVTCQVDEDLPYIIRYTGEDNLIVGSDYSHSDPSQEGHFPTLLQGWADRGEISRSAVEKILWDNAKRCYGL